MHATKTITQLHNHIERVIEIMKCMSCYLGHALVNVCTTVNVVRPLKSVTHGHCDARPTVTFPAAERHRSLTGTKLYGLMTGSQGCQQLAQSRYAAAALIDRELNP